MKPPVVATFLAMEKGNDLQSPIPGNQILRTSLIQIRGPQPPAGGLVSGVSVQRHRLNHGLLSAMGFLNPMDYLHAIDLNTPPPRIADSAGMSVPLSTAQANRRTAASGRSAA
jgi:hypothetical protein